MTPARRQLLHKLLAVAGVGLVATGAGLTGTFLRDMRRAYARIDGGSTVSMRAIAADASAWR